MCPHESHFNNWIGIITSSPVGDTRALSLLNRNNVEKNTSLHFSHSKSNTYWVFNTFQLNAVKLWFFQSCISITYALVVTLITTVSHTSLKKTSI